MHDIDDQLVMSVVHSQFPQYGDMSVAQVESAGTDHAMYRLGSDLVVRLPRIASAENQVIKEQRWLPLLASELPIQIPTPVELGIPSDSFPLHWSIYRWIDGDDAYDKPIIDLGDAAGQLGRFGAALRRVDATGGPPSFRGGPLALQEADVLAAITDLASDGIVDEAAALSAWQAIVELPQWTRPPVWVHGDLLPGNILACQGRISAVIDFGGVGVGDPACDMMVAWTLLTGKEREAFRECSEVDDDTWDRGRGWAFGFGLMAYHFHQQGNPVLAAVGLRSLAEALAEFSE